MNTSTLIWREHELSQENNLCYELGELKLWIKHVSNEIWIAHEGVEQIPKKRQQKNHKPDDSTWSRSLVKGSHYTINIKPVFPDHSVVVKPENAFHVLPDAQARIYVKVPLWVKIEHANKPKEQQLGLFPSVVLSNTWFGDFIQGELCYWISSHARREFDPSDYECFQIVCPVQIKNTSTEKLLVDKLCLRVKTLSIFEHEGILWANESRIFYRGTEDISKIQISVGPPKEASGAKKISDAKEPIGNNFAARTFGALKSMTGLGTNMTAFHEDEKPTQLG